MRRTGWQLVGIVGGFITGAGTGAAGGLVCGPGAVVCSPAAAAINGVAGAAAGLAIATVLFEAAENSSSNGNDGSSGEPARNPADDKRLSPSEIRRLERGNVDVHQLKGGKGAGRYDLFKDKDGNIYVKPKSGAGPGDPTGLNINHY